MFNPYLHSPEESLEPIRHGGKQGGLWHITNRLKNLDGDDLLIMLILYLIMKDGEKEDIWPLLAALIYCIL